MDAKDIFAAVSTVIALLLFVKGIIELVHSNAIRRYEKFHEMSVRFDESQDIQHVCDLLHGANKGVSALTKQQKEVFICFLEEIYFMMKSRIMKHYLALYSFGYYGRMAVDCDQFWQGLNKNEPFYTHFLEFCTLAKTFKPRSGARKRELAY